MILTDATAFVDATADATADTNGFREKVLFRELYCFVPLIALGTNSEYN